MQRARGRLPVVLERTRVSARSRHIAFDGGAQHLLQLSLVLPLDGVVEPLERRDELGIGEHWL